MFRCTSAPLKSQNLSTGLEVQRKTARSSEIAKSRNIPPQRQLRKAKTTQILTAANEIHIYTIHQVGLLCPGKNEEEFSKKTWRL